MKRLLLFIMVITVRFSAAELPSNNVPMPVFDIPRLDGIKIDGSGDDWGDRGLRVDIMTDEQGAIRPAQDFDPRFRLGWDKDGLLVLITVRNSNTAEAPERMLKAGSSVVCSVATSVSSDERYQVTVAPGLDPKVPPPHWHGMDTRVAIPPVGLSIETAAKAQPGGYVMELRLPWKNLRWSKGGAPSQGTEFAFQLVVNQGNTPGGSYSASWFPTCWDSFALNRRSLHRLRLSGSSEATPALDIAAAATYESDAIEPTVHIVTSNPALNGQLVEVRDSADGKPLASEKLEADANGRISARFVLPRAPRRETYEPLTVIAGGQPLAMPLLIPDARKRCQELFSTAPFIFKPFVFTGTKFPECDFEHPSQVRDLVGSYLLKPAFYDADFNEVSSAQKPGRYGAVVTVQTPEGVACKRYFTLYKLQSAVDWKSKDMSFSLSKLPEGLGLSADGVEEQEAAIASRAGSAFAESIDRGDGMASLLAALSELKPGSGASASPFADRILASSWKEGLRQRTGNLYKPKFLSWLPDGYDAAKQKRWPLVIFLHGSGERGDDLEMLRGNDVARAMTLQKIPAILIAPQCPTNEWWMASALNPMLDEVMKTYSVDPDRVYLTGLSMGGFGTFAWGAANPERFAALVPICGGGSPALAEKLKGLPIWAFHGDKDPVVPLQLSQSMIDAIQAVGGKAKLTVYPNVLHESWSYAYAEPELFKWMLAQRRGSSGKEVHPAP